jgi:hypothetical protein
MDKLGAKLGKEMTGHVKLFGTPRSEAMVKAASSVFQKQARRKVN